MERKTTQPTEGRVDPYMAVIYIMALVIPVLVLPGIVDNAFKSPKNLILITGAALLAGMWFFWYFLGRNIHLPKTSSSGLVVCLVLLNLFNLFYTQNYYYTKIAASLHIGALLVFFFLSIRINGRRALVIITLTAFCGVIISILTYLQFAGKFILFKWAHQGIMVMGTIGNSNYLGAYFIFPLFALFAIFFLVRSWWRLIPAACLVFMLGAFLFTRARGAWFGFFLSLPVLLWMLCRIYQFSPLWYLRSHTRRATTVVILGIAVLTSLWFAAPERFHSMMDLKQVTRSDTLLLRIDKYSQASWWLIKQSPLFGTGLWSFRSQVYDAQAEIEKRSPGFFENYPEPKPRRVHMEYMEVLNHGGIVAAVALALFFLTVMRHGWRVVRWEQPPTRDRVLAATAFCSLIAIMLNSVFFFPFQVSSTLFMTVLMLGILEGLYVSHSDLMGTKPGWTGPSGRAMILVALLVLLGWVWYTGIKPFKGEREHWQYKMALQKGRLTKAETHLLRAIDLDPHNTAYNMYAAQFYLNASRNLPEASKYLDRVILDYNGDITRWSVFYLKGVVKFQSGSLFEAREAFEQAIYYNPEFHPARQKLEEVNQVIKDHDRVMIKFR